MLHLSVTLKEGSNRGVLLLGVCKQVADGHVSGEMMLGCSLVWVMLRSLP